jgi:Zn-dependent M28 family amino/carboxypeptidase
MARYGPEGPVRVVVGAHYDTCGNTPGADDNASGVAGLLELGRLLGDCPPQACVELAAYPHEEVFGSPLMGSAHHAKALRESGEPVAAMVCLEMIGYFSDAPGSQSCPLRIVRPLYPSTGNFVMLVGRSQDRRVLRAMKMAMAAASRLPVRSICAPFPVPGLDLSDHSCFWNEGFVAVMVTDTAFYRNGRYHTGEDLPETLDYRRMAEVVRGVFEGVRALTMDGLGEETNEKERGVIPCSS